MQDSMTPANLNGAPLMVPGSGGANLIGYSVEARGACIGKVVDLVLDSNCTVEGLMVDTSDGRPALLRLRPGRIHSIDAAERTIVIHE
jgi:hypothetical protein